jgi:hypothetical protein
MAPSVGPPIVDGGGVAWAPCSDGAVNRHAGTIERGREARGNFTGFVRGRRIGCGASGKEIAHEQRPEALRVFSDRQELPIRPAELPRFWRRCRE